MKELIRGLIEKATQSKQVEEKSTIGLFFWLLGGLVAAIALIGKILDLDKPIALWLSHAITTNGTTREPELKLWFVPFIFLGLLIVVGFALMVIWTIKNHYYKTDDKVALDEMMSAVRKIRDQTKQTRVKFWDSLIFVYLINKDFSGSLNRISVMKSVDTPVHFWESVNTAEDEADAADSLATLNYQVKDLSSPQSNIVYLPSENTKRCKRACLFFLPPIQPGESRKFEISFQWPGLFKRLKKNSEDFEFRTTTKESLSLYRIEVYLQEGTKSALECEITGDQHPDQTLVSSKYEMNGWRGHGYTYEVRNVPAGDLRLILKTKLKD
jgi:hypothetical protein